ncbi:MAG: hypothetical protein ACRD2J_06105 [Thermoanaerobaculia bacterium]
MTPAMCECEGAVLRAVRAGFVGEDVRDHVGSCAECAELLELAGLLDGERRQAMAEASLPPAGALWFQMKLRAAREARVRSSRTALLIQGGSLGAALVIAIATFGFPSVPALALGDTPLPSAWTIGLLAASTLFAVVAPVAVWFAVVRGES